MPDQPEYNSRDLRLHRKYILVICFVIVFLKYGGVELSQIDLLGATFTIQNPRAIFLGLWVLLGYSVMRYYQFFRHESLGYFITEYRLLQERNFKKKFFRLLEGSLKPDVFSERYPTHGGMQVPPEYYRGIRISSLRRRLKIRLYVIPSDIERNPLKTLESYAVEREVDLEYHFLKDFWKEALSTAIYFAFNTPFFFEFIFPFILILGTLIYSFV